MSSLHDDTGGELPLEIKPDLDRELIGEFISDAREQLENIEQGTLALESDPANRDVLHKLFRAFHTFKGNAGFLDFTPISQLSHLLESLLGEAREGRIKINSVMIEIILKSRDTLLKYVDEIEGQVSGKLPHRVVQLPTAALKAAVRYIMKDGPGADKLSQAGRDQALDPDSLAGLTGEAGAARGAAYVGGAATNSVKVGIAKLDGLVDLAGELLIAQSLIVANVTSPGTSRHTLARNLDQLNRIGRELQRTAMSMRMVPLRATLQKLHRLVRDLSARQKKQIELVLEGEDTEVDRAIAERIGNPLMHMVRNAIDHAIEPAERRAELGKRAVGTIHIRAYHKSGNVFVEVEDDGAGLNRERIRAKAGELGLLKSAAAPTEKELLGFILQPGFSTAEVVTNVSGRGVGMDVVNKNVGKLRGRIEVASQPGHGTTFTIRLPLTLAVIDGLIVRVGDQRYIIPTISVRESFHPNSCKVASLPGNVEVIQIREELVPLLRLREHFGLTRRGPDTDRGIVVVIETDGEKRCLLADELVGKQEVVIKNLGEVFKTDPIISGGAILGDGCVGLILDAAALVQLQASVHDFRPVMQA